VSELVLISKASISKSGGIASLLAAQDLDGAIEVVDAARKRLG